MGDLTVSKGWEEENISQQPLQREMNLTRDSLTLATSESASRLKAPQGKAVQCQTSKENVDAALEKLGTIYTAKKSRNFLEKIFGESAIDAQKAKITSFVVGGGLLSNLDETGAKQLLKTTLEKRLNDSSLPKIHKEKIQTAINDGNLGKAYFLLEKPAPSKDKTVTQPFIYVSSSGEIEKEGEEIQLSKADRTPTGVFVTKDGQEIPDPFGKLKDFDFVFQGGEIDRSMCNHVFTNPQAREKYIEEHIALGTEAALWTELPNIPEASTGWHQLKDADGRELISYSR